MVLAETEIPSWQAVVFLAANTAALAVLNWIQTRQQKRTVQEGAKAGAEEAVRPVQQKVDKVATAADTLTEKAAKVEEVVNGQGIMGALRRILHWQSLHEQADVGRHDETTARIRALEQIIGKQHDETPRPDR